MLEATLPSRGRISTTESETGVRLRGIQRVEPPSSLTAAEKKMWREVVATRPPSWFSEEHFPLLEQYCRHKTVCDRLSKEIAAFTPKQLKQKYELMRYSRLLTMQSKQSQALIRLARAMRLTQQSTYGKKKAFRQRGIAQGRKPWQRDA